MKHKLSITLTLLGMFLVAQIVGILVINSLSGQPLPLGLDSPESGPRDLALAILLAFFIFFTLMKYRLKYIIKAWFFLVILLALIVSIHAFIPQSVGNKMLIALPLALVLTTMKVFRPGLLIHNGTEIFIYPGIGYIIGQMLNVYGIFILLVLIAIYDAWAVWHSGIMQKMAKYQIEETQIFGGFLVPHLDKKTRQKLKNMRQKYTKSEFKKKLEKKKVKVNVAILGGGDIVFPIITMAVFMRSFPEAILWGIPGLIPAIFILVGSFLALTHLFIITKKDKAYPAMPWISTGAILGIFIWWLTTLL